MTTIKDLENARSKEQEYKNLTHRLYNILMEYWNYIPEEEREAVDKKLKALGL